jgi:hypothetical protein
MTRDQFIVLKEKADVKQNYLRMTMEGLSKMARWDSTECGGCNISTSAGKIAIGVTRLVDFENVLDTTPRRDPEPRVSRIHRFSSTTHFHSMTFNGVPRFPVPSIPLTLITRC